MTDETEADAVTVAADETPRAWPLAAIVLAVVFGLLFAWFLYQAIGNLLNSPAAYEGAGFGDRIPWAILVAGVAIPVVAFVVAAWLGLRRSLTDRVLLFAAGLGVTAATAFSLLQISQYLLFV